MEQIIRAALDELESQESVLLTWGNTQGFSARPSSATLSLGYYKTTPSTPAALPALA